MSLIQTTLSTITDIDAPWRKDWLWGIPLIIATVILHCWSLTTVCRRTILSYNRKKHQHAIAASSLAVGAVTLSATILHAIEAAIWAAAFCTIGTMADAKSAMLYSLGALTTFGNQSAHLAEHWRLLGAIEALNGWLLFGLSTAFLFWLIQELSPTLRSPVPPSEIAYDTDSAPLPHP